MKIFLKIFLLIFIAVGTINAKVKIKSIDYKRDGRLGVVTIFLNGQIFKVPDLMIKNKIIQVSIPNSFVWPKIEKQISVNKSFDSTLMAYQFSKDLVRVRANLPYSIKGDEAKVSVLLERNKIKLYFPVLDGVVKNSKEKKREREGSRSKKDHSSYDESYLEKLLKDKENVFIKNKKNNTVKVKKDIEKEEKNKIIDIIKAKVSGIKKNNFSISSYILKFIVFFIVLAGGFYLLMNFFRKGFLKKGSLGFLTGSKMVEVLNTTYIGPKRSLLIVSVNKQVFLMSQSEKGMDFLTEIKDTTAFFKEGEKIVNGSNFDTTLENENGKNKKFKLKEMTLDLAENNTDNKDLNEDSSTDYLSKEAMVNKEKVSFSRQIRNKMKNLKSLQ